MDVPEEEEVVVVVLFLAVLDTVVFVVPVVFEVPASETAVLVFVFLLLELLLSSPQEMTNVIPRMEANKTKRFRTKFLFGIGPFNEGEVTC